MGGFVQKLVTTIFLITLLTGLTRAQCPVIPEFDHDFDCVNQGVVLFKNLTTAPGGGIDSYLWDFGDGSPPSTLVSPLHVFGLAGTYFVQLTAWDTSGCFESITHPVVVVPLPSANFVFSPNNECADVPIFFDAGPFLSTGVGLIYEWQFGDGNTVTTTHDTITHRFYSWVPSNCTVKEFFLVTLTITDTNGCQSNISKVVSVGPLLRTNLIDMSGNNFLLCNYSSNGTLTDTLWVGNYTQWEGCVDYFNIGWGDGQTSFNLAFTDFPVYHVYSGAGVYTLYYYAMGNHGCAFDTTYQVTVESYPTGTVTSMNGTDIGCAPLTTQFTLSNLWTNGPGSTYTWDWGDGSPLLTWDSTQIANYTSLSHTYSQTHCTNPLAGPNGYLVSLYIENYCGDTTIYRYVQVLQAPEANFTTPGDGCIGEPYCFTNTTIPGYGIGCNQNVTYLWDFGYGDTSTQENPCHTFAFAGYYDISLTAYTTDYCYHDTTFSVYINGTHVDFTNDSVCLGDAMNFQGIAWAYDDPSFSNNPSISIISYLWDFGGGNTSTLQNTTFTFGTPGFHNVSFTAINEYGCDSTITQQVYVGQMELDSVVVSPITCHNADDGVITVYVTSGGGTNTFTLNPLLITNTTGVFPNLGPGNYTVFVIDQGGCFVLTDTITIVEPLEVVIDSINTTEILCFGDSTATITAYVSGGIVPYTFELFPTGTVNSTGIFINLPADVYFISVQDANACPIVYSNPITISQPPEFTVNITAQDTGTCLGVPIQLIANVSGGTPPYTYSWSPAALFNDPSLQNPYALPVSDTTFIVVVTDQLGCQSTDSIHMSTYPLPISNFIFDHSCVGIDVYFYETAVGNGATIISWDWDFGDGGTSTLQNPVHMYSLSGIYPVTLIVWSTDGCSDTLVQDIEIFPDPVASFDFTTIICDSVPTQFTDLSIANADSLVAWWWDFGDGDASTIQHPIHTYTIAGIYPVTLIVENSNGCLDDTTIVIEVYSSPTAAFYTSQPVCLADSVYFYDNSSPGSDTIVSWFWDFGDGNTSTLKNPAHLYNTANTFMVTLLVTNANGCTSEITGTVMVEESPIANFNHTLPCWGSYTQFTDLSVNPGIGVITSWTWDFGDGNTALIQHPTHIYAGPGFYNVMLTVVNNSGCIDQIIETIEIYTGPEASFTWDDICLGYNTYFYGTTTPGDAPIVSRYWDFGDGNTMQNVQNPVHEYATVGFYTVMLVVEDDHGCIDTVLHDIIIYPGPTADFTTDIVCVGNPTQFIDLSHPASEIVSWFWNFGDPTSGAQNVSTLQNPQHTFSTDGFYSVALTVVDANDCLHTLIQQIYAEPAPIADFMYTGGNCANNTVQFIDLSSTYTGSLNMWIWDYGDGTIDTIISPMNPNTYHLYQPAGQYTVTLTVYNSFGCSGSTQKIVVVVLGPDADFTFVSNCYDESVQFHDITQGGNITSREWDFDDPASGAQNYSTLTDPLHVFSDTGIYYVSLMVIDVYGCRDTIIKPVHVLPLLSVEFYWIPACEDEVTQFYTDTTVVNTNLVTSYFWDFGDGYWSNLKNPGHVYDGDGVYNVILTITDTMQCENSIAHQVTVKKMPDAYFDVTEPVCLGDSVFFNDLSTTAVGYIVYWVWDFNDGSPLDSIAFPDDPNVYHKYDTIGTFGVTLSVTNSEGCTHTYMLPVQVIPGPEADFIYTDACSEQAVQFIDNSNTTGQGEITYQWNFGDPASGIFNASTLQNPEHTYVHGDSTYYVTLIIENFQNCSDTIVKPVYVRQSPPVAFLWDAACEDTTTYFYPDSSVMNVFTITSWFWDFGDGTYSYEPDPVHQFAAAGIYYVTLTVQDTGVCTNSYTALVIVNESPVAMFTIPQIACQASPVYFDDLSYGQGAYIYSWHWDFGDGTDTSIYFPDDPDVYHEYENIGMYAVILTVVSADSCDDQLTQLLSVIGSPEAMFDYDNACSGEAVQFHDQSSVQQGGNIISWNWNFGDPSSGVLNTSSLQDPEHTFTAAGIFNVTLVVVNSGGCTDTIVRTVSVLVGPPVDFTYEENCLNQATLFFTDTVVTNVSSIILFEWDFGDGTLCSNLVNPEHYYEYPGIYDVTLTVTDTSGCDNMITHEVEVVENPVALFGFDPACEGTPIQFIDASYTNNNELITDWIWNFGDPASGAANYSTEKNPVHQFSGPGAFEVQLVVIAETGCRDSISLIVNIYPAPAADFIYEVGSCSNGLVEFTDMSAAFQADIVQWKWIFEPGYQSAQQHPSHAFLHLDTIYIVSLIVMDSKGCRDTIDKDVFIPTELVVAIYDTMDCFGEEMIFSAEVVQPLPNAIYSYSWNFGDPASGAANISELPQPTHVFTQPGVYIVTLNLEDLYGCNASIYKQVYIHELPEPDFTFEVGICDGIFHFTDQTTANGFDIVTYIWDFGDGTPPVIISGASGDVIHVFSDVGIYTVTLTVEGSNGCYNNISKEVEREACLLPIFGIVNGVNCQYADVIFADSSTIHDLIQTWYWDFGDGKDTTYSVAADFITHTYLEAGEFKVRLAVSAVINNTFFTDTTSQYIAVRPGPLADFLNDPVCAGGPMMFIDSTLNNNSYPVSWHWDFGTGLAGDTSNLSNPSFVYHESGEYEVSMITVNNWGCSDIVRKPAFVQISPTADFEFTIGCLDESVDFTDLSYVEEDDEITAWIWNFGDGTTNIDTSVLQNPTYTYAYLGDKQVELIVYNSIGCKDTLKQMVSIHPNPTAGFNVVENYDNQQGNVALEDQSLDSETYYWDFGDGYSIYDDYPPVIHSYEYDDTYMIEQVVWNEFGCPDTAWVEYDFMFKTLFIPNALNPNGMDPEIKVFQPKGRNLKYFHIAIYNSWGEKIWESSALDQGRPAESWDGTYEGKLVQTDVYIWKAEAVFLDGTFWEGDAVGNTDGISKSTSGMVVVVR